MCGWAHYPASLPRQLFLLGLTLARLAAALNLWAGLALFSIIGGYIGRFSALRAVRVLASGFAVFGTETHSPGDDHQPAGQPPHAV